MARTNQPHPRSKLYFSCRFEEYLEGLHRDVSIFLPEDCFEDLRLLLTPSEWRYCSSLRETAAPILRTAALCEMIGEGFPASLIEAPEMAEYAAHRVDRFCLRAFVQCRPEPSLVPLADHEWRPSRSVVVDVIAGEHLAFGEGNRSTTADRLNAGIPRDDRKAYRTDGDAVRNALESFIGTRLGDPGALKRRAEVATRSAMHRDFMWTRLAPLFASVEGRKRGAVMRLIADGTLLDLYTQSTFSEGTLPRLSMCAGLEIHRALIRRVTREWERRAKLGLISPAELARFRIESRA